MGAKLSRTAHSPGDRIRLGFIGGGSASLIGPVHRMAARLDDRYELVAGIFSADPQKSAVQAQALGVRRGYGSIAEMIAGERDRPDGVEAVSIMTPNDTHAPLAIAALAHWHVLCEKPLANDADSARETLEAARRSGHLLCITHNYSGYPMVREARAAIAAGEIGKPHLVQVSYMQGNLGVRVEDDPSRMPDRLKWRLDPAHGGASHVLGDIGTHAYHLASFMLNDKAERVLADVGAAIAGRQAHDTASVILRMKGGARGVLLASKAATGAANRLQISIHGDKGGIIWDHANPMRLEILRPDTGVEIRQAGQASLHEAARRAVRIGAGHPEAFIEAFANLYRDFADLVVARKAGDVPLLQSDAMPTGMDGLHGLDFIDACLASSAGGNWAEVA